MRGGIKSSLAIVVVLLAIMGLSQAPALAADPPSPSLVFGYVTVNGIAANGLVVTLDGSGVQDTYTTVNDASGRTGYYQFSILNGSSYTVTASYNGQTARRDFTASSPEREIDLGIVYTGPPMPGAVYGYVTTDGSGVNGATVYIQGGGSTDTYVTRDARGHPGYFEFSIVPGTQYTLSVTVNPKSASKTFSTFAAMLEEDLQLISSQSYGDNPTPAPTSSPGTVTITPSPSPSASPSASPTPAPSVTPTPTLSPSALPSNPGPVPSASPVPFPGIEGIGAVLLGAIVLAIVRRTGR